MPRFDQMQSKAAQAVTGNFAFTGERIEKLQADDYTLVHLLIDKSSSVYQFQDALEKCLKDGVDACKRCPKKDNLLIRVIQFGSSVEIVHDFKLLTEVDTSTYSVKCSGATSLKDAMKDAFEHTLSYGSYLADPPNNMTVNGDIYIVTDGEDNDPQGNGVTNVQLKDLLSQIVRSEKLESMMVHLIGVNTSSTPGLSTYLQALKDEVGINNYLDLKDATPKTMAKLANWISKSVSSGQVQALGTGGPSQAITF